MTALFDHKVIARLAGDLAHHLGPAVRSRSVILPARFRKETQLPDLLEPGVVLFICRLSAALHGGDNRLVPVLDRFFADPATAEALLLPTTGEITQAAAETFIAAKGDGLGLGRSDFEDALGLLIAATGTIIRLEPLSAPLEQDEKLPLQLFLSTQVPPDLTHEAEAFVTALTASGLDRVEDGGAVAADGVTVIFSWKSSWATAAEPPPSAGPEDAPAGSENVEGLESVGELEEIAEVKPTTGSEPSPAPPPPAPSPGTTVALRLDAALPEHVTVGRAFDLAVAIRMPASPPLAPDDLARRESTGFAVAWPSNAAFIQLRVQISAPDCLIHEGDSRSVRLLAGQDGPPIYFQLTPQRDGPLSIIITVYQETDWVGSTRLRTEAKAGKARGKLAMTVESRPLGDTEVNLVTLRQALDDGYNDSELRDLCFELGIDYDDLPGDNQSAKARELVLYAKRRDLTARLVERVMKDRPHLLAPV